MLSTMKTLLFVSLALASNAALPPWVQAGLEEERIRSSPHLNELIGDDPKFGITKMESVRPSERQRAGYSITKQYTVSARTHGEGFWMTQQGYIERDFTVYVVRSKKPLPAGLCGPAVFGLMFEDDYVEDPAAGQSGYVNHVKPVTKVPADCNGVKPRLAPIGPGGIGPAWTRGEIEAPEGVKDMGSYKIRVYTPEQQARLGVDEYGRRVSKSDKVPADCNGVKPSFPPMGPGPVIIDGNNTKLVNPMIKFNPNSKVQCLPRKNNIGYITERRMVGTLGHDEPAPTPFRSNDESVVTCKLVNKTPRGFCGGEIYQQQFIAKNFGRTTVTNGETTYTIQVGQLQ